MSEKDDYTDKLENYAKQLQSKNTELNLGMAASGFNSNKDENLIRYQLEFNDMLGRIERFLRGDKAVEDAEGNVKWNPPELKEQIFNEYGIQTIMRIISMYLNRDTVLSNYDEPTIIKKVKYFALELNDLIYTSYEEFGLYVDDTEEGNKETEKKLKLVPIIILSLSDLVHSTYLRALHGMENKLINENRIVTQSENMGNPMMPHYPTQKRFSLLKPSTWGR